MEIKGAVALVTGANGGLGTAFVRGLLKAGAKHVYAAARDPGALSGLASEFDDRITTVRLDINDPAQAAGAASQCSDLSLLVNNAGANLYAGVLADNAIDAARTEIETNFFGTLNMCRTFAPVLAGNGGGGIINILSIAGIGSFPMMGTYSASKAAQLSLTQSVRADLKGQGTRVYAVLPAAIDTPLTTNYEGPKDPPEGVVADTLAGVMKDEAYIWPVSAAHFRDVVGTGGWDLADQLAAFSEQ